MTSELAHIAASQVGVRESSRNAGDKVRAYQLATTLKPARWAWCAAFVCWCVREWLAIPAAAGWLGLRHRTPDSWRPKTARAFGFRDWARGRPNTTKILPPSAPVEAGDLVIYEFSHVGIALKDLGSRIEVVEGNTNNAGSRESLGIDGVFRKVRCRTLVLCLVRIHSSSASGKVR